VKNFDEWNEVKKNLESKKSNLFFNEREIWWCSLGLNLGFEQDGNGKNYDRPILIIKKFNNDIFLCLPLTTSKKQNKFYIDCGLVESEKAQVIISQFRLIDKKRLIRKIQRIDKDLFRIIKYEFIKMFI
jgi:mRNA interferase MazF